VTPSAKFRGMTITIIVNSMNCNILETAASQECYEVIQWGKQRTRYNQKLFQRDMRLTEIEATILIEWKGVELFVQVVPKMCIFTLPTLLFFLKYLGK
jgi:hypothetical protein